LNRLTPYHSFNVWEKYFQGQNNGKTEGGSSGDASTWKTEFCHENWTILVVEFTGNENGVLKTFIAYFLSLLRCVIAAFLRFSVPRSRNKILHLRVHFIDSYFS